MITERKKAEATPSVTLGLLLGYDLSRLEPCLYQPRSLIRVTANALERTRSLPFPAGTDLEVMALLVDYIISKSFFTFYHFFF